MEKWSLYCCYGQFLVFSLKNSCPPLMRIQNCHQKQDLGCKNPNFVKRVIWRTFDLLFWKNICFSLFFFNYGVNLLKYAPTYINDCNSWKKSIKNTNKLFRNCPSSNARWGRGVTLNYIGCPRMLALSLSYFTRRKRKSLGASLDMTSKINGSTVADLAMKPMWLQLAQTHRLLLNTSMGFTCLEPRARQPLRWLQCYKTSFVFHINIEFSAGQTLAHTYEMINRCLSFETRY